LEVGHVDSLGEIAGSSVTEITGYNRARGGPEAGESARDRIREGFGHRLEAFEICLVGNREPLTFFAWERNELHQSKESSLSMLT
jgi:hypothetical protein